MEDKKKKILKKYFGYSSWRGEQEKVIDCILSGRDVLCVMPTGAGKSVCYQVPALMKDGVTLVVSPLISLMNDQVMALVNAGIKGAYINSSLTEGQYRKVIDNINKDKYKIIYVAPERLKSPSFLRVCENMNISMIAVDEAHCVSQWGQDFRPGYLGIANFIDNLPVRPPVSAFTATATRKVRDDIIKLLDLDSPEIITTGFDRPNLYFGVIKSSSKMSDLIKLIYDRRGKSGIVYCATRKNVENVCADLNRQGFKALRYHAGLSPEERARNQDDFTCDKADIMVATNAFGMGIDKSNISYVIHYNMPKDLESYYQEAGRAGRDGSKAECILLYSPKDVVLNEFLIENSEKNDELTIDEQQEVREKELERLKYMTYYCNSAECLRHYILKYFGENSTQHCDNCSVCINGTETFDISDDAAEAVRCINESGQRFGRTMICNILKGSTDDRIYQYKLDRLVSYGKLGGKSLHDIHDIIDFLLLERYIISEGDKYPVLKIGPKGRELLKKPSVISMTRAKKFELPKKKQQILSSADEDLFSSLRNVRKELASSRGVPPYVICSDATLNDICIKKPLSRDEMLDVYGMGEKKTDRYGEYFLKEISRYL